MTIIICQAGIQDIVSAFSIIYQYSWKQYAKMMPGAAKIIKYIVIYWEIVMKKIASVGMVVILTMIALLYIQINSFVPAQTQENEIQQDFHDDIAEKDRGGRTENLEADGSIPDSAGSITGEDDFCALSEEEREVLLTYADYLQKQTFRFWEIYRVDQYIETGYEVDGVEVSEEEFHEAWEKWNVDEMTLWGYDDAVLMDGIDDFYRELCRRISFTEEQSRAGEIVQ